MECRIGRSRRLDGVPPRACLGRPAELGAEPPCALAFTCSCASGPSGGRRGRPPSGGSYSTVHTLAALARSGREQARSVVMRWVAYAARMQRESRLLLTLIALLLGGLIGGAQAAPATSARTHRCRAVRGVPSGNSKEDEGNIKARGVSCAFARAFVRRRRRGWQCMGFADGNQRTICRQGRKEISWVSY